MLIFGVDINSKDDFGMTPLKYAISASQIKTISFLLKNNASFILNDELNINAFHEAAKIPNLELNKLLYESCKDKTLIFSNTKQGNTVLHYLAKNNNLDVVEYYLNIGLDKYVNSKNEDGKTPIFELSQNTNPFVINFLMDKGLKNDINLQDKDGRSPFFYCLNNINDNVVKLLLSLGSKKDLILKDSFGITPLHIAATNKNYKIINMLLETDAIHDINSKDKLGQTPPHYAANSQNENVIRLLLLYGADVNSTDNDGMTPLHHVFYKPLFDKNIIYNAHAAYALLEANPILNSTDKYNARPIRYAAMLGDTNLSIVKIMLKKNAICNKVDLKYILRFSENVHHFCPTHRVPRRTS